MENCNKIPIEKLIEYSDGELEQKESEQIAQHIANCHICKNNVQVLENSLSLAQNIWENDKEKWGDLQSFNKYKLNKYPV